MQTFREWLREAREAAYFFESFDSHYDITETKTYLYSYDY